VTPLSDADRTVLEQAGSSTDQAIRGRACAIVLAQSEGADRDTAGALLVTGYLEQTQPSFHLIPRGTAMATEPVFESAYEVLAEETKGFTKLNPKTLTSALERLPLALAPLRMIAGLTYNELAVAIELATGQRVTGASLRSFERLGPDAPMTNRRTEIAKAAGEGAHAVVGRKVLTVPKEMTESFHSKTDKRDTHSGWKDVSEHAAHGVPYWALLYQRYVGGVWRQVQDAYSEVKGDELLELPLQRMLSEAKIPFFRAPAGATGASEVARRFGIHPGPDFLIPEESPSVIVESKVGEDGGTVRDKAARIKTVAEAARQRSLVVCAVVDGKGWSERPGALLDVVLATGGRTFTLSTMKNLPLVPEVAAHVGTVPEA
jgi:hypothetical protein